MYSLTYYWFFGTRFWNFGIFGWDRYKPVENW